MITTLGIRSTDNGFYLELEDEARASSIFLTRDEMSVIAGLMMLCSEKPQRISVFYHRDISSVASTGE